MRQDETDKPKRWDFLALLLGVFFGAFAILLFALLAGFVRFIWLFGSTL